MADGFYREQSFLAAFGFCGLVLGWNLHAAEIGGIALSTTSVAVVYAVMVETGLNRHDLGKLILAACFITDLGTVLALGGLFASYGWLLIVFAAVSAVTLLLLPRLVRLAITRFGHRVSEPEIKLLLVKLAAKMIGVWPVATAFGLPRRERTYTTLLMATGLTFGSIAALFGLTHHLIGRAQYTELVTVVILSAFVPTLIAQQLFRPAVLDSEEEEALGEEDLSIIHHRAPGLTRQAWQDQPGIVAPGDDRPET